MKRKTSFLTVFLLAAFLFGFAVFAWIKPSDAQSQAERRNLTQFPAFSLSGFTDGKWTENFESYTLDQFPLREQFRTLKSLVTLGVFRQKDNNGVYLADGFVAKLEYPLNEKSLQHAQERFKFVYDTYLKGTSVKTYLSIIPDKNYFLAAENGYPALDYGAFFETMQKSLPWASYIDLTESLTISDYYKTDIHWRQESLLPAAKTLASAMGAEISDDHTVKTLDRDYYGLYYGYAALPIKPEKILYLTNETIEAAVVTNFETGKTGPVYDMEKAAGKDPYEMFLSGSVSLLTIENPKAKTDKELVIFRDSFASSLAPLLLDGYAKITLVDIRYLPSARLGSFLAFSGQDVLFLYSVPVLNNSETIK